SGPAFDLLWATQTKSTTETGNKGARRKARKSSREGLLVQVTPSQGPKAKSQGPICHNHLFCLCKECAAGCQALMGGCFWIFNLLTNNCSSRNPSANLPNGRSVPT